MPETTSVDVQAQILSDLIESREKMVTDWIKFIATVQAGLAIAFGVIVFQKDSAMAGSFLGKSLAVVVAFYAIVVAVGGLRIVRRERIWQQWYNFKLQSLTSDAIFPEGHFRWKYPGNEPPRVPNDIHPGRITETLTIMVAALVAAWMTVGLLVIVYY